MKKRRNNLSRQEIVLDKYEQEIENAMEKDQFVKAGNFQQTKKLFAEAAKTHKELHKTKRITLRVKQEDLIKVKVKAKKNSIPYQRLISALIHQYAEGKMNLVI